MVVRRHGAKDRGWDLESFPDEVTSVFHVRSCRRRQDPLDASVPCTLLVYGKTRRSHLRGAKEPKEHRGLPSRTGRKQFMMV